MGKTKKIFAVSDVHGHYSLLKQALDAAGFNPSNENHLLVCCGDYFDRGTENLKVLKFFDILESKVLLRGNHEDMLLEIFNTGRLKSHNYLNGTVETIVEFFGKYALDASGEIDFSGKTRMLDRVTDFIMETKDYFETEHYVFTHGWLPTCAAAEGKFIIDNGWRTASPERWKKARWTKWNEMNEVCRRLPDKTIVCGHVPSFFAAKFDKTRTADQADIFYGNGVTVIDAGTYSTGRINVLVIEDNLI